MTTWFISRHPGAREWVRKQGVAIDRYLDHLRPEQILPGDTVIGSLPVNLAAEVCQRGACYLHLSVDIPPNYRGKELTTKELERFGARLEAFSVRREPLEP